MKTKIRITQGTEGPRFGRAHQRLNNPTRCTICGSKRIDWENGFPGEYLLICNSCNTIINSQLNTAEII